MVIRNFSSQIWKSIRSAFEGGSAAGPGGDACVGVVTNVNCVAEALACTVVEADALTNDSDFNVVDEIKLVVWISRGAQVIFAGQGRHDS